MGIEISCKQCCKKREKEFDEANFSKTNSKTAVDFLPNKTSPPKINNKEKDQLTCSDTHSSILYLTLLNQSTISSTSEVKIKITNKGYEKSPRQCHDGLTFFGYEENDLNKKQLDYNLPPILIEQKKNSHQELSYEKCTGKFFQIAYRPIIDNYYLKDLGNGLGTFIKLSSPILLVNNSLISIGDSYLSVGFFSYETNDSNVNWNEAIPSMSPIQIISSASSGYKTEKHRHGNYKIIQLRVYDGSTINLEESEAKLYIFNSDNNKTIRIGRKHNNNQIDLDDLLVSKTNSVIDYIENEGWYLYDGNIAYKEKSINDNTNINNENNNRLLLKDQINANDSNNIQYTPSTNGTWLLAIDNIALKDNMIFKSSSILFSCHLASYNKQSTDFFDPLS